MSTGKPEMGIKGVSPLFGFRDVDIIKSMPIDDLHSCFVGVNDLLLDLWMDSKSHGQNFYIGLKKDQIDSNLLQIIPPRNFARSPRSVTERKFWKANEHRAWLFYYGIPCLINILPSRYLQHYALFSESIFILSKAEITQTEILTVRRNLNTFVKDFQTLYSPLKMVYNVHLLTHLVQSVVDTGPLWATSTFHFESNNGKLVSFVHGTKDPQKQIFTKYFLSYNLNHDISLSEVVKKYCQQIDSKNQIRNSFCVDCNTVLLGKGTQFLLNESENLILDPFDHSWEFYMKIIINNEIYSSQFSGPAGTNDSYLKLKNGSYALIKKIIHNEIKTLLIVEELKIETFDYSACCKHVKCFSYSNIIYTVVDS